MKALLTLTLVLTASAAHADIKVVATLPSLAAIAKEIGGELADVDALASPTEDPHFVDAKPSLVLKLNRADVVIANGVDLEVGWLPRLLVQARNPKVQIGSAGYVDASTFVTNRKSVRGTIDRAMGDVHPQGNPHYLYDPRSGAQVAKGIGERFGVVDPANAATYAARTAAVVDKLTAFAKEQSDRFDVLPVEARRVVSYHDSFPYLFEWLHLESVITVEPKPGVSPDPGHVAHVLQTMRARGARAVVQEQFYPAATSRTLTQMTKTNLVVVGGSARFPSESYFEYLKGTADALYAALVSPNTP